MSKKILVCEFHQESNAFSPFITDEKDLELDCAYEGDDIEKYCLNTPRAIKGICDAVKDSGAVPVFSVSIFLQSGGILKESILKDFVKKVCGKITETKDLDGAFVSLHGATQSEETDDVCGYILENIRKVLPDGVISASLDLHANVTEKMAENADILCGYNTYPHSDFYETGYRAGSLGMRKLSGENLKLVRTEIPMIVPASGYSTLSGGFAEIFSAAHKDIENGLIEDFSLFQMQPWMDVGIGASAVLAIGKNTDTAKNTVMTAAEKLYSLRDSFIPKLYSIDEVIKIAEENRSGRPIILCDSSDSTNAGAAGDSPKVLERLIDLKSKISFAMFLDDEPAAEKAFKLGVGETAEFSLGATKDKVHSRRMTVTATVRSLHDGIFKQEGPAGKGLIRNIGKTAVLSVGNKDILVCSKVSGNGDPQLFRHFGIEPDFYDLVCVKACTSFKAAYSSIGDIYPTDTPGAAAVDLSRLDYKKLPKSFYPFTHLDGYKIPEPKVFGER